MKHVVKILLADDEQDIRELLKLGIGTSIECEFLEAENGQEAIQIVDSNPDLFCIVCDYNMPKGTGGDVFKHLVQSRHKAKYILCSGRASEYKKDFSGPTFLGAVEKPYAIQPVISLIQSVLEQKQGAFTETAEGFRRVSDELLLQARALPADVYIKLSDSKYLLRFKAGEVFTQAEVKALQPEQRERLFVKQGALTDYFKSITEKVEAIRKARKADLAMSIMLTQEGLELLKTAFTSMGVTKELQESMKQYIGMTVDAIEDHPRLAELFKKMNVPPGNYVSTHSVLISHIACQIVRLLGWNSDTTYRKLCLAAFIHDMTIDDKRVADKHLSDILMMKEKYSDEIIREYLEHPDKAAELAHGFDWDIKGVETILLQHHAPPEVGGFPKNIDFLKLDSLSQIFIFAEEIADAMYSGRHNQWNPEAVIDSLKDRYSRGAFRKVYDTFRASIKGLSDLGR